MIYSNPEFILFFVIVLMVFVAVPVYLIRLALLITASLLFYAWAGYADTVIFLFVVVFSWLSTFLANRFIRGRAVFLSVGIFVMLAHLFFWKYAPWIASQIQIVWPEFLNGDRLVIPLPVGISFFTLQGIAYLIDFKRGETEYIPLKEYVLFKSFFPQLVAGPIVRVPQLLPQLKRLVTPSAEDLAMGLNLFALGFVKKIYLADKIAPIVDTVFASPQSFNRGPLILGIIGYTVQIWADFSGYTDMGRGAARMLGIRLPANFLSPYWARSPSEFWTRWHITLSTWIRDYIYIPLGGNRGHWLRTGAVALLTMSISGLWHGANWNYLLWGFYHGILLLGERGGRALGILPQHASGLLRQGLGWFVMLILTMAGWLLFRVQSLGDLLIFLRGIFGPQLYGNLHIPDATFSILLAFFICMGIQGSFFHPEAKLQDSEGWNWWRRPRLAAWSGLAMALLVVLSLILRTQSAARAFIYFQF